jgi:hypothetical protein
MKKAYMVTAVVALIAVAVANRIPQARALLNG